jgi:hypothetical protein
LPTKSQTIKEDRTTNITNSITKKSTNSQNHKANDNFLEKKLITGYNFLEHASVLHFYGLLIHCIYNILINKIHRVFLLQKKKNSPALVLK